jgi:nitroreductase
VNILDAIRGRRSIKRFTERAVSREDIEQLIDAAVQAPNHKLTQPWRFYVLGPEARHAYGAALGRRKAKKAPDENAAREIEAKTANEHRALPAMIAVAFAQAEDAETREEDYAATFMAVQNLSLAAHQMGLGAHVRTGAVMQDPAAREAIGVKEGERVVATLHLGQPAELPPAKARKGVGEVTTWMP